MGGVSLFSNRSFVLSQEPFAVFSGFLCLTGTGAGPVTVVAAQQSGVTKRIPIFGSLAPKATRERKEIEPMIEHSTVRHRRPGSSSGDPEIGKLLALVMQENATSATWRRTVT